MRRPPSDSPVWILGGAALSGAATYGLLVVVGRALDPAQYGRFSLFWSGIVIASLGAFLPVEQVLARRTAHGGTGLLGRGIRLSVIITVASVAVFGVVWLLPGHGSFLVVAAFAAACSGFALQFPGRGVLAGRHELGGYALVVCVDAVGRLLVVSVLWAAGVRTVGPYVLAVAASAVLCGLVGVGLARRARSRSAHAATLDAVGGPVGRPAPDPRSVAGDVGGLLVATLAMQLLLNSPVVVAGTAGDDAARVAAGHMLALLTLVRVPVFLAQSAQGGYVARAAGLAHRGRDAELRRLVAVIGGAVLSIGVLTVVAVALVGPQVVAWVFGPDYVVSRGTAVLAGVGVGAYLLASVANDLAAALGSRRSGPAWAVAALVGATTLLAPVAIETRALLPLLVGSAVAAGVMVPVVLARVARTGVPA
jgi:O-antigen/teichoic acid export membrane protein